MKLIKVDNIYTLMDGDKMIASSDSDFQTDYEVMKLSKQNCDEIFGVTDVNELANQNAKKDLFNGGYDGLINAHQQMLIEVSYINGFKKAMELNKDKLFTEADMIKFADDVYKLRKENKIFEGMPKLLQSLQQPKEIEVRIAMRCSLPNGCTEPDVECTCEPTYNLDENGCLTLWVLNI